MKCEFCNGTGTRTVANKNKWIVQYRPSKKRLILRHYCGRYEVKFRNVEEIK